MQRRHAFLGGVIALVGSSACAKLIGLGEVTYETSADAAVPSDASMQIADAESSDGRTILAMGQVGASSIAVANNTVYWTVAIADGGVMECATTGCAETPDTLVPHLDRPSRVAAKNDYVAWVATDHVGIAQQGIVYDDASTWGRCSGGCSSPSLTSGGLYWIDTLGIQHANLQNFKPPCVMMEGGTTCTSSAALGTFSNAIGSDAWEAMNSSNHGAFALTSTSVIFGRGSSATMPLPLVTLDKAPLALALEPASNVLYFMTSSNLYRVSAALDDTGMPQTTPQTPLTPIAVNAAGAVAAIATSSTVVCWTTSTGVDCANLDGTSRRTVVVGSVTAIAVDASGLYWIADGAIMMRAL